MVGPEKLEVLDQMLDRAEVYTLFIAENMDLLPSRSSSAAQPSAAPTGASHHGPDNTNNNDDDDDHSRAPKRLRAMMASAEDAAVDTARTGRRDKSFAQPVLVTGATLREYQLAGVEWMKSLFLNGAHGILADEMGLGKTLQTIAFLCHLREMKVYAPFLVVCPLTVGPNWVSEFRRFAPTVPVTFYHGTKKEREGMRAVFRKNTTDKSFPVIVTSFDIAMRDRLHLAKVEWKYIVLDEGHRIKNLECKLVKELKKYKSANRLLLTGTPLQTKLSELWSLLNFLLPDIFDDLAAFEHHFDFDGDQGVGQTAKLKEQEGRFVTKLHRILRPFLLRRLKIDVVNTLPPKIEIVLHCGMTKLQRKYYDAALREALPEVLARRANGTKPSADNKLMQLRKCCNHPYLMEELSQDGSSNVFGTDEKIVTSSSKMMLLDRLLPRLHKHGHKVLLFSQMTRMLDIVEDYLDLRGHRHGRIDGSTPLSDRMDQMKKFNDPSSDLFVFLLSTRAGGLGINLVAADTIVFYDSDFNPQNDLQAEDRAHRIGQTRPVHVYRLCTQGSVEEALLHRANERRKLEQVVMKAGRFDDTRMTASLTSPQMTDKDLDEIVNFKSADSELGHKPITDRDLDRLIKRT